MIKLYNELTCIIRNIRILFATCKYSRKFPFRGKGLHEQNALGGEPVSEASGPLFMASITGLNLAFDLISEAIICYAIMQT